MRRAWQAVRLGMLGSFPLSSGFPSMLHAASWAGLGCWEATLPAVVHIRVQLAPLFPGPWSTAA